MELKITFTIFVTSLLDDEEDLCQIGHQDYCQLELQEVQVYIVNNRIVLFCKTMIGTYGQF